MDLETKFKKETGFDAYADNDLRPKVPSDYYVEWLEEQLILTDVSSMLILTPKDAELFFNEIMNPKKANEALKKAMLKFITR
jgi:hypothetical protein